MTTQHTPGPWETSRDAVPAGYTQITVYAEATGVRVATVFEAEANARLIAAAPDLLVALQNLTTRWDRGETPIAADWSAARAAIARATGGA